MKKYTALALFMLLAFASTACAQESALNNGNGFGGLVVEMSGSKVNWGDGYISATSEILPMQDTIDPQRTRALAVRQGGVETRKKLLDTVLSLSLDGSRSIADVHGDDLKVMNSLRGFIQNSLLETSVQESGTVTISASLDLRDGLSSIIIPPTIPFLSGIAPTLSGKRSDEDMVQELSDAAGFNGREAGVHSGVVIDARGFRLNPVLLPLIYDGRGVGVYGAFSVSREAVIKNGLVAYMTDEDSENLKNRVGNFPLKVKPVNVTGTGYSDLILSLEDGAKVKSVLKRKSVVDKCSVVILVDNSVGGLEQSDDSASGVAGSSATETDKVFDAESEIKEEPLNDSKPSPAQQ